MNKTKLIFKTGIHKLFKPFYGGMGHAVMLHRVYNEDERLITRGLQVKQDYIENVINYFITKDIDIVSLDEFYERITSKNKTKRFVTFTFDDGYLDNLTHALPVFEKFNAPFSVFVCTGYVDKTAFLWWYLLEEIMLKQDHIQFSFRNKDFVFKTKTNEEKRIAFAKIKTMILECNNLKDYNMLMEHILKNSGLKHYDLNDKLIMTQTQTKKLGDHPLVTLGAHTLHHLALRKLSEEEVYTEIKGSVERLKEITGKPVEYFAYPYGTSIEAGRREFSIAEKCGLKMAFTTEKKNISRKQSNNLFSIPRVGINPRMELTHLDLYMNGFSVAADTIRNLTY
ncbi:Polysaccharide deacetylase [Saccharicrinis carchari]|uniref:Polysaccharide deacetylase n=1 Tax=Saccharicrinis carchari TaxID=1168039 RepID=A0A521BU09_SACCC|nr:polysaccharide deacetylase family protein [Saccharicrinis carchari]SMO50649.1 Polysaccharide deacetylase [Saccharicrinis carchari]